MSASYPKILKTGTQEAYNNLASKDSSVLYWTSDTHKIYKGEVDFSESVSAVASRPTGVANITVGKLYLCADTGKAEFYDGTAWHTVAFEAVTSFDDDSASDSKVPTTNAVKDYVADMIGSSADVVKSIAATVAADVAAGVSTKGKVTYVTADDAKHVVTVPDVFVGISDKVVEETVQAGKFVLTDSEGDETDYTVKGVGTGIEAGATAAKVKLNKTTGSADEVTIPGVMTGIAADEDPARLNVTMSTGTHADVVVPGVVVGLAAKTGENNNGKVEVTLSTGTHADVVVPGVIKSATMANRVITFTDTDGNTSTIDIGKDIFIDSTANNRYENGNIYLYLNDGTADPKKDPTEIVIPVTGLITDYIGDDTDSIVVDVNATTHHVTATARLRADKAETSVGAGDGFTNALKVSSVDGDKGLYVDLSDVEDSIDALADAFTWGTF